MNSTLDNVSPETLELLKRVSDETGKSVEEVAGVKPAPQKKPPKQKPKSTPAKKPPMISGGKFQMDGKTPAAFLAALAHLGFDLRFNERSQMFELKTEDRDWYEIDDHEREHLRLTLLPQNTVIWNAEKRKNEPCNYAKELFQSTLYAATHGTREDPFKIYLQGLPTLELSESNQEWLNNSEIECDEMLEIDKLFYDLYLQEITDMDDIRWHSYVSRVIFLAQVHRTFNPGCKFDEVVVITGAQGVGKDALFQSMVPQGLDLMTTSLKFSEADKVKVEKSLGKSLVVASEMAGLIKEADIDSVKQWITAQTDRVRFAYRTDPINLPRRFIVVCTSNSDNPIPNDPTGNRRWLVVKLQKQQAVCRVEDFFDEILDDDRFEKPMTRRDIMWAEAMALYNANPHETAIRFPNYLKPIQAMKNLDFAKADEQMEEAWIRAQRPSIGLDITHPYTTCALFLALKIIDHPDQFTRSSKANAHRVDDLMTGLGWQKKQVKIHGKRVRCWVPPEHELLHTGFDGNVNSSELNGTKWIKETNDDK